MPFPAVLMLTGENDGRVNPMQSRKMIARLQDADYLAFLFEQLGMRWPAVAAESDAPAIEPQQ